ncbi:Tricorn protease domain-containing protein [Vibrio coralliilyticus]|uniref:Tricorn protease domain-containing protein n=1 Tax=Vibrio coralliilyticus TaxID=190893 RepID=UPI00148CCDF0|nr:Tricorn protease domain-containing protein [Vibrio coralliilyticus]NOH51508.1 Tricorn protease domain-containing protein [Vibrio coralliilyticus]
MKKHSILTMLALALLAGCNGQDTEPSEQANVVKEQKTLTVEERIAEKNAQQWEDGRVYITEHNYVTYDKETGKPSYAIYKAKEWPREDLSSKDSYDLPRVVFRWDNARNVAKDHYDQRDKVWSIKTDGTDLRLVADEFVGIVKLMRMSPNNRYLALAYSAEEGMFKVIKDLKTGEYIELGRSRGYPEFLWAEDSSYLYYVDQFKDWKYTLSSGEKQQVDVDFNEYSVIYDGKRVVANDFGVAVYDEAKDKFIFSVGIDANEDNLQAYKLHKRGISPTGKYVWGESGKYRYLIDVENKTFQSEVRDESVVGKFEMLALISKNGNYARSDGAAQVFLFQLNNQQQIDQYMVWKQTGGTGQSATGSFLYNAFANDGDFVKGESL